MSRRATIRSCCRTDYKRPVPFRAVQYVELMAIIHRATISPSKLEMIAEYLPSVPSLAPFADASLTQVGAYRFDDPAGDVGIETLVLANAGGALLQVPLTYRSAPIDGGEAALLGPMEHSVLGPRWIYNACHEAVYVTALATTIVTGGVGAREVFDDPDRTEREPSVVVQGTGAAGAAVPSVETVQTEMVGTDSHLTAGDLTLVLPQVLDLSTAQAGSQLVGTWAGLDEPVVLATMQ